MPADLKPKSVWVVSLTEENDKFAPRNKDRYYTQGLKVAMNRGDQTFFSLTQEINTPSDTTSANPSSDDQPYSGALYLGWGYGDVLDRDPPPRPRPPEAKTPRRGKATRGVTDGS